MQKKCFFLPFGLETSNPASSSFLPFGVTRWGILQQPPLFADSHSKTFIRHLYQWLTGQGTVPTIVFLIIILSHPKVIS